MGDKLQNEYGEKLYELYPVIKEIDYKNDSVVVNNISIKRVYAEDYMATYGESCSGFMFILAGKVKILRINEDGEETNLYDIGPGELCHEALSCFVENSPLNIIGKAVQDSLVAVVPFEVLKTYCLSQGDFLRYIYKDLHDKFNLLVGNKERNKHKSVKERLIKYLMAFPSEIIYGTHKDIALELDSAREVISRILKDMEKQGYIKLGRGKITILKDLQEYCDR